ncbi:hypothetical protein DPEC_G00344400 [Dallia pectoralis]|uniref:Uncharacterized protein n=1 Tax=Dallia pectoralis TaxID=75939 RepID=A0ACC2F3C4_DALPE|nr:hypothetical protein DPEC_G00344400 [Dallia pectoralis]
MIKEIGLLLVFYLSCVVCLTRYKRQTCQDGDYLLDGGQKCCYCAAGQYLVSPCISSPEDRNCQPCEENTYNSGANKLSTCEPCTSCDPKLNLEVVRKCTFTKNTVCQCQKGFFCLNGKESCSSCRPCATCGDEGINVDCTITNDTKCNDVNENGGGSIPAVVITIVIFGTILVVSILVYYYLRKNKKCCFEPSTTPDNPEGSDGTELQHLIDLNLQPHLREIAELLGWPDMRQVAERSGMADAKIEAHQLNYPNDAQEQCFSLLKAWVERAGMKNSSELITILYKMEKRTKAEQIIKISKPGRFITFQVFLTQRTLKRLCFALAISICL